MGEVIEINKQRYPAGKYKAVTAHKTSMQQYKAFSFSNVLNVAAYVYVRMDAC